MFYARSSGLPVPIRLDSPQEVARVVLERLAWGAGGVLLAVPIPEEDALSSQEIQASLSDAVAAAAREGVVGAAITPFVLGEISKALDGRNIPANLALSENNARVAGEVAAAMGSLS